jgi:hypothetical protein
MENIVAKVFATSDRIRDERAFSEVFTALDLLHLSNPQMTPADVEAYVERKMVDDTNG